MASSPRDAEKVREARQARAEQEAHQCKSKQSKMRESLNSNFCDPLLQFKTPEAARKLSKSLDEQSTELERRIRTVSSSSEESITYEPSQSTQYIHRRKELAKDVDQHFRSTREELREALHKDSRTLPISRNSVKRALKELDAYDNILLRERAGLASERIRIEYAMRGHWGNQKVGEAYLMALTSAMDPPHHSTYDKPGDRSKSDQSYFRSRLLQVYQPVKPLHDPESDRAENVWCPIARQSFAARLTIAARIVPFGIGEANASYVFGCKPGEGHGVIFSEANGLMMHGAFQKPFDHGVIVIVPDPTDHNEFMTLILAESFLLDDEDVCPAIPHPWRYFHKRRLQFQTPARPSKRYLYVHAVLMIFQRKRYDVPGWQRDRDQVFMGQIWATPGKWARKSMVEALAVEMGDKWEEEDDGGALAELPGRLSPEEEADIATVMRYGLGTQLCDEEDEDDDDDLETVEAD